jgi:hypothetical protein
MKQYLGAAALAAVAALAVPSFAHAHGSVYKSTAKVGATLTDETRYFVTNHGFSFVLRETNGLEGTKGMVAYNLAPGAWRTGKDFATVMAQAGTGVQPHATCVTPALETEAAIKSWQDADAFYNYVPFQRTSAGLEDDPARWLPTLTGAGFDVAKLDTAANAEAECERVAGATYFAADATQSSAAALSSGTVAEATEPLNEEIEDLEAANAALTADKAKLTTEKNTLTSEKNALADELAAAKVDGTTQVNANGALNSKITSLTADLNNALASLSTANARITVLQTPMKLTLTAAKVKAGAGVTINGLSSQSVSVTLALKESAARKLKLRSSVIGKASATTGADGAATVTVKLSKAAAKALKSLKGSLAVTAQATSGDRFATDSSKLTR